MPVSDHPYLEDEDDPAGVVALLDALDEGHDVETWPEHDGQTPDVSNWGNERTTEPNPT